MKRWIHGAQEEKRYFRYPQDIEAIEEYVAQYYDPDSFTCVNVCEDLARIYDNLVAVPVQFMWIDGHPETNHYVCLVKGDAGQGCNMIDPTGDQFLTDGTNDMRCAAFHRVSFGFVSNNYAPMHNVNVDSEFDGDIVFSLATKYPEARLIAL